MSAQPSSSRRLALAVAAPLLVTVAFGASGCAAPADDDDGVASSEDALTALGSGHYVVERAPLRGSYVAALTIAPNRRFEMEYVRVRETTEPLWGNPFFPVPVRKEEKLSIHGAYQLYASDGQRLAFRSSDAGAERVDVGLEVRDGKLVFTSRSGTYTLKPSAAAPSDDRAFVARCKARTWEGTIRLDRNARRRGTFTLDARLPGASDSSTPKVGATFAVAYTGDTGVEDAMGFEGEDRDANAIDFTLRRAIVEAARPGATFQTGFGYTRDLAGYAIHHSPTCTVVP